MRDETKRNLRIGLLSGVALAVLGAVVFTVGNRQQLFTSHTRYHSRFSNVTGLQEGAPVKLNGVTVGFVEEIAMPTEPTGDGIEVRFSVDAAFTERIREDTQASIRTMGLLGDKYLELSGGSPGAERVLEGGLVEGRERPEVDQFVSSGEDLMENLLAISSSLKVILRRVEAGEGLLGELTISPETGGRLSENLNATVLSVRRILERLEAGDGFVGRLLHEDPQIAALLTEVRTAASALSGLAESLAEDLERDGSLWATMVRDPETARNLKEAIRVVSRAGEALAAAAEELAAGEGTLPRLLADEEYADDFLTDLHLLIRNLQSATAKIDQGDGTAGALINDPQLYQDLENVVRGIKSSKVLSWFVRNRRRSGEEVAAQRAAEAREQAGESAPAP